MCRFFLSRIADDWGVLDSDGGVFLYIFLFTKPHSGTYGYDILTMTPISMLIYAHRAGFCPMNGSGAVARAGGWFWYETEWFLDVESFFGGYVYRGEELGLCVCMGELEDGARFQ